MIIANFRTRKSFRFCCFREYKIFNVILNAYQRAVANCPWASTLWRNYLLALERSSSPWEKIEEIFNQALEGGYSSVQEAADLWLQYCYQIRRKISSENSQDFLPLRTVRRPKINKV